MRADDIARLLVRSRPGQNTLGWHTGVVESWDELTGLNSIDINGSTFNNLLVLSSGSGQTYQPNDVVGVIRVGTQYFILGQIRAPGAGAGERIASDRVAEQVIVPNNGGFDDLAGSYGPEVQLYVGSSRRVLVIHSCEIIVSGGINISEQGAVYQAVQVTGASDIPVETGVTDAFFRGMAGMSASATGTTFVTSANGLQQGLNTFTCKYKATAVDNQTLQVNNRVLTVIPF